MIFFFWEVDCWISIKSQDGDDEVVKAPLLINSRVVLSAKSWRYRVQSCLSYNHYELFHRPVLLWKITFDLQKLMCHWNSSHVHLFPQICLCHQWCDCPTHEGPAAAGLLVLKVANFIQNLTFLDKRGHGCLGWHSCSCLSLSSEWQSSTCCCRWAEVVGDSVIFLT